MVNIIVKKKITSLVLDEIAQCKKNVELLLSGTEFSEFERMKIWESSLETELNEIKMKLRNFNSFEVYLNNILDNEILLTDKALRKLKIKDILEQIDDIESGNSEKLMFIPNILFEIINEISSNEEVQLYLKETKMNIPKIKAGICKLFESLLNNTAITAAPKDEDQRRFEYVKLLKGYKVVAIVLKESSIEPILKLGNIITIAEASDYCASGWKDTLLELISKFSFEIKEKYKDYINLDYEKDPLKIILNEIFFNARECITKELSYNYIKNKNISIAERPHYIDIFKQVFNDVYNLNLPFIETNDSYLGEYNINDIKDDFIDSLKNTYINDLIYNKACELFYDRLKEEPDYYIGSKVKPKFWGDIMEWCKKYLKNNSINKNFTNPVEFMSEYIIGDDSAKNPIRYIAIKEIMKDCGFIEEVVKDERYGDEFYKKHPKICMTRLKRGIMDIKNENELSQLNDTLLVLHSRGINVKGLIDFIKNKGKFELIKYINLNDFNISIDSVDMYGQTALMKVCKSFNDSNSLQFLINANANVNFQNSDGITALMYAVKYNRNIKMSQLLVENGADVNLLNNHQWNALMLACYYSKDLELVKLLVKSGSNLNQQNSKGWTPLISAIRSNRNIEISKFLIENGSDINISDNELRNSLMLACHYSSDLELIKLLINEKTDINQQDKNGWTALMYAIEYNKNPEILKYLIVNGANVNLTNNNNSDSLIFACRKSKDLELIKLLVRSGSNLNQQDIHGYTALMHAIETNKNSNIPKYLIESGANVNLLNNNYWNALMFACRYSDDVQLVKLLIYEKSNISQKDIYGWNALKIAKNYNKNEITKYLIREKSVKSISNTPIKSFVHKILK
ncbi:ankyrin [Neocallimastix sp. 'constans']|jgi:ankyrin repeat protein